MPVRVIHIKLLFWAALGIFTLGAYSCSEPASPFGQTAITIEALDASCTEVWLELKFSNLTQPADVAIQKDGKDYLRILSLNRDTLLVFEYLEPSTNYSFRAIIRHEGKDDKTSNSAPVRTMDTTSHSFTWQTFTFGEHSSSTIYDVAIIDENNIWAVGEIYMKDSLGNPDPNAYNAVHWDGIRWELRRIPFYYNANPIFVVIRAVFAFNANDIWFGGGVRWDGVTFKQVPMNISFPSYVNKIWGSSSSNIYIVGNNGNIAHYNGTNWKKIENGTFVNLNDVWGGRNRWVGDDVVLVAASEKYYAGEKKILQIKNDSVINTLPWQMQDRRIHSIWFDQHSPVFTAGGGVFQSKGDGTWREMSLPLIYTNRIRGNALNDLITGGDFGLTAHYNGVSWKVFDELKLLSGNYESVAIKGNVVVAVGWDTRRARLTVGIR